MKRVSLFLLAVAVLATNSPARAQNKKTPQATPSSIGLIDIAHVFQEYDKFEDLRNDLQAALDQSEAEGQPKADHLKKMQQELKNYTVGSPEYEQKEKAFRVAKSEFEAFRARAQRSLARQESEMFKEVYFDVRNAAKLYAEYKGYTMVIRFNRKQIDDTMQPQQAVQTMNKTVIYYQPANDITQTVLDYLDKQYKNNSPGTPARSASRPRTVPE